MIFLPFHFIYWHPQGREVLQRGVVSFYNQKYKNAGGPVESNVKDQFPVYRDEISTHNWSCRCSVLLAMFSG